MTLGNLCGLSRMIPSSGGSVTEVTRLPSLMDGTCVPLILLMGRVVDPR